MRTRMKVATLVAVAAAVLTACSNSDDSSAAADFNQADVTFAQEMIPHHRQATEMAGLADGRTTNQKVLSLAKRITAAQGPEITSMTDWLKSWDKKVPSESGGMEGMDHGSSSDMDMPGMMSDEDMKALESSSGAAFDEAFLTMMIAHHQGAITMAGTEETDGKSPEAIDLAKKIQKDQASEISEMQTLLRS